MSKTCIIAWVYGRVQGVGFRCTTQYETKRLGLTGYIKNLGDGSVEVVAYGKERQVGRLVRWLKSGGPRSARVERVLGKPHHPSGELADFRIRQIHFTGPDGSAVLVACLAGPFESSRYK